SKTTGRTAIVHSNQFGAASQGTSTDAKLVTLAPPAAVNPSEPPRSSIPLPIDEGRSAKPRRTISRFDLPEIFRSREAVKGPAADLRQNPDQGALGARVAPMAPRSVPPTPPPPPVESDPAREPVRLLDPPPLHSPPIGGGIEGRLDSEKHLAIPQIRICQEV